MTAAMGDNQGLIKRLQLLAGDIKLSHSVFALPFAVLAAFLAAGGQARLPGVGQVGLIVLCMVFARTSAMAINRWADREFDKANPRTAGRAIPSGRLSARFMLVGAVVSGLLFGVSASGFWVFYDNPWPFALWPLVLAWLLGYSYTKRFTALCHIYLGLSLALSPVAAALAINPAFLARPDVWLLFAMVATWVAGFDIIYAMQDVAIDQTLKLHSLPARLGTEAALNISRVLHVGSVVALGMLFYTSQLLGTAFLAGIVAVAGLLVVEHALVWRSKTRHLNIAFLTVNGVISLLLGALGTFDVISRV
jgi:4-hydroxybenzoate polyprenyltransferase